MYVLCFLSAMNNRRAIVLIATGVQLVTELILLTWTPDRPRQVRFLLQAGADIEVLIGDPGCEVSVCSECVINPVRLKSWVVCLTDQCVTGTQGVSMSMYRQHWNSA